MRPVNLIPTDQRRAYGPSRTGPIAYIVVGALGLLLVGVVVMVLASNQISERESDLESLAARSAAANARAEKLAPYAKFQQVERQRTTTVYELADSRFDWPRVLRQLSLIVPKYVVLGRLTGLAGPGVESGGGGGESGGTNLANGIKGPSLSLSGCALNQNRVAALVAALHQIDGVTRVGLSGAVHEDEEGGGGSGEGASCKRVSFNIAVAFDAAPVSPDLQTTEAAVTPTGAESSPEPSSSEASSSESSSGGSGGTPSSGETTTATKTEPNGSQTTVSKTTTVNPPSNP